MLEGYKTLKPHTTISAEIVEKKSRFISFVAPVQNASEAQAFIDRIRQAHKEARHVIHCYMLSNGECRMSDDGEPTHTAGLPCLEILKNKEIFNVCVCVVRYFGGVLLGVGGLKRAYAQALKAGLERAQTEDVLVSIQPVQPVRVTASYQVLDLVKYQAQKVQGKIRGIEYQNDVVLDIVFLKGKEQAFLDALKDVLYEEGTLKIEPIEYLNFESVVSYR